MPQKDVWMRLAKMSSGPERCSRKQQVMKARTGLECPDAIHGPYYCVAQRRQNRAEIIIEQLQAVLLRAGGKKAEGSRLLAKTADLEEPLRLRSARSRETRA
jgi:hypothetical protein